MPQNTETKTLRLELPIGARAAFAEYSAMERKRRQDSATPFDQNLFDAAVELVMRTLKRLEDENHA